MVHPQSYSAGAPQVRYAISFPAFSLELHKPWLSMTGSARVKFQAIRLQINYSELYSDYSFISPVVQELIQIYPETVPSHLFNSALSGWHGPKLQPVAEPRPPGLKPSEMLPSTSVWYQHQWEEVLCLRNCPGLTQGLEMHKGCFSTWALVLISVRHPSSPLYFRLSSASLRKDRYRGVGYLSMTTFSNSSSTATESNLTSPLELISLRSILQHVSPLSFCASLTGDLKQALYLIQVNTLNTARLQRYRHKVLLIHPEVSLCFHCFAPNTLSPAHWGVLLALQWNITQQYPAYTHLCFSWGCWRALHSPDHASKVVRTALSPSAKFFLSL